MNQETHETARRPLLHAASALAILGLDWLLFSGNFSTAFAAIVPLSIFGFLAGATAVTLCQRKLGGDNLPLSCLKGIAAGIAVGLPFPIAGTAVGGFILTASGLNLLNSQQQKD